MIKTILLTTVAVAALMYSSYRIGVNECCVAQNKLMNERTLSYNESVAKLKAQHAKELEELTNENKLALDELRKHYDGGVCPTPISGVTTSADPNGRFICFERNDFYARLKRTMDIAAAADKVTADYKLLLKMVETSNAQK